jgi:hypothetical protein
MFIDSKRRTPNMKAPETYSVYFYIPLILDSDGAIGYLNSLTSWFFPRSMYLHLTQCVGDQDPSLQHIMLNLNTYD